MCSHEIVAQHPEVLASTEWIDPTLCVQWLDTNGWDLDSGQIPSFSSTELPSQPPAPFLAANITAPHLHMHPPHPAHDTSAVRPTLVPELQEPAVIVISDSDDEPRPPPRKVSRKRRAPEPEDPAPTSRYGDNPVRLNKRIIADTCKTLDDAPEIWDVPRPGRPAAAYLLDLWEKQHDNKFNISGRKKLDRATERRTSSGARTGRRMTRTLDVHHRFTAIPHNVVEKCILRFFAGEPVDDADNSDDEDSNDEPESGCQYIIHPQRGRKGESSRTCPCSNKNAMQHCQSDQNDRRAVVFPRPAHHHNHPIPPSAKVPFAAQEKYRDCVAAYGFSGVAPLRVDLASSTKELLNGNLPAQIHPALGVKQETRPYTGLQGIIAEKIKEQQLFEASNVDRGYIRSARLLHDNTHLIVCMNPYLAKLIHRTPWIMIDTTFKCVHGDTNQWKLPIWVPELNMRVVAGRVWLNKADNTVYQDVWNDVFKAIEVTTGKRLLFKVFDKRGNLLAVLADGEAAQAIGTGAALADQHVNNPEKSSIPARTGPELLLYVYCTCWVHWCRGTEKVGLVAGSETQRCLRDFPFLDSQAAREEFGVCCSTHPQKEVCDWWAQKKMHAWLLPSISRHLTKMPLKFWDLVPSDTNALEGSHADDNHMLLLAGVLTERASTRIQVALESGILPNGQKTVENQFSVQASRRASERRKIHERAAKNDARDQLEERLKTPNLEKQALNEQLKDIKGSSPRKKRSANSRSSSSTTSLAPGIPPATAKASSTNVDPFCDIGTPVLSTLYQPPYSLDPPIYSMPVTAASTTGFLGASGNLPAPPTALSAAPPSPALHPETYHVAPPMPSTDYTHPYTASSNIPFFGSEFVQGSKTLDPAVATLTSVDSTLADPFFFDPELPIHFY
ncbi:hypothetical protein VTO73DRAFT_14471 [Trametes versicolor]